MPTLLKSVLVLEDNPLIAMDQEFILRRVADATVFVATSVADATSIIDSHPLDFALLDVELDGETSEAVADNLSTRRVPFVFVSGYDMAGGQFGRFAGVPSLLKPLNEAALRETLVAFELLP